MLRTATASVPGFDFRHEAAVLGRTKTARVVVPDGPAPPGGWPTCYLLHSFGGDRLSWPRMAEPLLGAGVLLVCPESGRRWFLNDAAGHRYEDYLLDDLVPAIDAAFPADRRRRVVGGFSMGGAAATFAALRRPDVFRAAFSYAGAFYAARRKGDPYAGVRGSGVMMPTEREHERVWGPVGSATRASNDPERVIAEASPQAAPALVLEVGTDDHPRVVEMNRMMHRALAAAGLEHSYLERAGGHTWPDARAAAARAFHILRPTL